MKFTRETLKTIIRMFQNEDILRMLKEDGLKADYEAIFKTIAPDILEVLDGPQFTYAPYLGGGTVTYPSPAPPPTLIPPFVPYQPSSTGDPMPSISPTWYSSSNKASGVKLVQEGWKSDGAIGVPSASAFPLAPDPNDDIPF
jgi:hypothetical protein